MTRSVLALTALVLVLAGCASHSDSGPGSGTARDTGGTGADVPVAPDGADEVVLRIETAGGYVPLEHAFGTRPTVVVTGDGTVLQPAPETSGAWQPHLVPFVHHTADESTLAELVVLADEAGLLATPPDYTRGAPMVTDMPSTTVTLAADGRTWTHSAYALGFEAESGHRAALAGFVDDALDLLDGGDPEPWTPRALRLTASELSGVDDYPVATPWPEEVDLAGVGACSVVDDPAAVSAVVDAITGSPDDARYLQGGRSWSVTAAVVLPGEVRPCADW